MSFAVAAHHAADEDGLLSGSGFRGGSGNSLEGITRTLHCGLQGGFVHRAVHENFSRALFMIAERLCDAIHLFKGFLHVSLAVAAHHALNKEGFPFRRKTAGRTLTFRTCLRAFAVRTDFLPRLPLLM